MAVRQEAPAQIGHQPRGFEVLSNGGYRLYPSEPYLTLEDLQRGTKLMIPRRYLFGTQALCEYSPYKERSVKQALESRGLNFLLENPIFVCMVPDSNAVRVVIIDGHNRARFSAKRILGDRIIPGVGEIPSLVYTMQQTLEILSRAHVNYGTIDFSDEEKLRDYLCSGMRASVESFSHVLPDYKQPRSVQGVTDLNGLKNRFDTFSHRFDSIMVIPQRFITDGQNEVVTTLRGK